MVRDRYDGVVVGVVNAVGALFSKTLPTAPIWV